MAQNVNEDDEDFFNFTDTISFYDPNWTPDADTIAETVPDSLLWTPEERWVHHFCDRLNREIYTKRNYSVGVSVFDLTADSVIYAFCAHDKFIPASNQKLFVSIAALSTIGPDYNFSTDIYYDGEVQTVEVEVPDIIERPIMTEDGFNSGEVEYDTVGVKKIPREVLEGNVYVFGGFDPTLDKTPVNYIVGKLMGLGIDSISGKVYSYLPYKEQIPGAWFWDRHPSWGFAKALYNGLVENGITFTETDAYDIITWPRESIGVELTTVGQSLPNMIRRMMKNSDNYYAESMLLNLCDLRDQQNWTYGKCKQVVRDMVARAGGNPDEYVIADGSGLSHSNLASPDVITRILRYAYHTPQVYDTLYDSLPIAGVDGTLGSRMKNTPAHRNVRAKTGTVNGVSTLSGYLKASNGHDLAFAILVNKVSTSQIGRAFQNRLCIEMAK